MLILRPRKTYRTHRQPNNCADITPPSDIEISRKQRRHIRAGGYRVGCDVRPQLGQGKSQRNNEDPKPLCRARSLQEPHQQIERIPYLLAVDNRRRGRHNNPDKRCNGKPRRDGDQLRPDRILRGPREPRKVGVVHDQGCKVSQTVHDSFNHRPGQLAPVSCVGLVHDRANSVSAGNGPGEERNGRGRGVVRLDGEQVPDLVDGEPEGG